MLFIEIRPGEGGDDAYLFAEELRDALAAFARRNHWPVTDQTGPGARTLVLRVDGTSPSGPVAEFAGVHRVQRIPANDKRGRRHTSTATVAVLAEPPGDQVDLRDADLRVDYFRGTGPGGQHRNKTSSAVRLRHLPSGIVVTRTSGRSQQVNLADARTDLAQRLAEQAAARSAARVSRTRRAQIAGADRPVKQFTHNQQRSEVVDHERGRRWTLREFAQGRLA